MKKIKKLFRFVDGKVTIQLTNGYAEGSCGVSPDDGFVTINSENNSNVASDSILEYASLYIRIYD